MEKKDFLSEFTAAVEAQFAAAFEQVAANVVDILSRNAEKNASDDEGVQSASLTVQPKIRIDFTAPACVSMRVTIPAKSVEQVTGEASCAFNLDQPDLPLK